jgi:hypothetical protein
MITETWIVFPSNRIEGKQDQNLLHNGCLYAAIKKEESVMTTGSFRNCANIRGAVSISIGVPQFYHGPQYKRVAPRREMLKMDRADYDFHFKLILMKLDPQEVYRDLGRMAGGVEPILLCWERPNTWCHRRKVAEWLEDALGIEITEYGFARGDILPYCDLTETPPLPPAPPPPPPDPQLELF